MATAPPYRPPAPFQAPTSGTVDERLSVMAAEINRKANASFAGPVYAFLGLVAPDGSTWQVTVDNTGALQVTQVPRT